MGVLVGPLKDPAGDESPIDFGEHPDKDECRHLDLYHGPHPFPLACHFALILPKVQEGDPKEEVTGLPESTVLGGKRKLQFDPFAGGTPESNYSTGTSSQGGLSALWPFLSGPNLNILLLPLNLFVSGYGWS